ncbi:putative methyltransferase PMT23 [Hibiscus syriacus]|uniref:Methyltransferase n=1 Tax=Hibiscus syriacus TaxID=106335 RepID=A0A6A2WNE5_HIBSY|nr:putative methyltransferase PMT23 [Hibiscus syriacus]
MGERNYPFLLLLTSLLLALPFFFFTFSSSLYPFLFAFTSLPISSDFHVSLSPPFSTPPISQEEEEESPPHDIDLNATSNIRWKNCRLGSIWYSNVPHPKLVEYKKDQNWVHKSGDYFVFPGGDVGSGVASFGGYLLDKDVITMSFAPKDEHEAQMHFALERGIPATLSVIGTRKLTFLVDAYDLIHCARNAEFIGKPIVRCLSTPSTHSIRPCRRPLLELNRVLRPGGFIIWSATPVYQNDQKDRKNPNALCWSGTVYITAVEALTKSICWKVVAMEKRVGSTRVGLVIYQKPSSRSCYDLHPNIARRPPLCDQKNKGKVQWNEHLSYCISRLPVDSKGNLISWPAPWPRRLTSKPQSLSSEQDAEDIFNEDTKHWASLVSDVYFDALAIKWASVRNVMDMNAVALNEFPLWVMNVVPIDAQETLPVIFERGLDRNLSRLMRDCRNSSGNGPDAETRWIYVASRQHGNNKEGESGTEITALVNKALPRPISCGEEWFMAFH